MAIDYVALKNELLTDPQTYGYAPLIAAGSDNALADLLNKVRDGSDGEQAVTVRKADVSSKDIWEAIALGDFPSLPQNPNNSQLSQERRALSWLEGLSNIEQVRLLNDDGSDTPVVANLGSIFPAGTGTRNRLLAIASRFGSRAEELFGTGAFVTALDVAIALRQTP